MVMHARRGKFLKRPPRCRKKPARLVVWYLECTGCNTNKIGIDFLKEMQRSRFQPRFAMRVLLQRNLCARYERRTQRLDTAHLTQVSFLDLQGQSCVFSVQR